MKEWWTLAEFAEENLFDVPNTIRGIDKLAKREGWADPARERTPKNPGGTWRRREGRGGGIEYHFSVLHLSARAALVRKFAPPVTPVDARDDVEAEEAWRRFNLLTDKRRAVAQERLRIITQVDEVYRSGCTKLVAVELICAPLRVSPSAFFAWEKWIEGVDRQHWLAYLADRHVGRTVTADCSPEAWDMLKSDYLRQSQPSFKSCYYRVQRAAKERGWELPSARTLLRRLQKEVSAPVQVLARKGEKALEGMYPAQVRDRSIFGALEGVNADGHRWDVAVKFEDGSIGRPVMVAFQDLYSGLLLSHRIEQTENAWSVRLALGDMVETWGIPLKCWLDNGRAFASKWLTGGIPNRYRFKVKEEEPQGILTQLGVEIHWTRPYHGQSKPIERAWRDLCDTIARHPAFEGAYLGNSVANKPENRGSRAIPIEEFRRIVASEIAAHNERTGRTSKVAWGTSFLNAFNRSYSETLIKKPTEEQRRLWLLAAEGVRTNRKDGSLTLADNRYAADWLTLHRGENLVARFDPDFLQDGLHIFQATGAYLGFAPCVKPVGFEDMDAAREHARARRAYIKATRAALDAQRRMSAAKVAELVPPMIASQTDDPKIVQLARPTLDLKRQPTRVVSDDVEARHAATILEFNAPKPVEKTEFEKSMERFRRALEVQRLIAADREKPGSVVLGDGDVAWLEGYETTSEYRGRKKIYDEAGEAMFAGLSV